MMFLQSSRNTAIDESMAIKRCSCVSTRRPALLSSSTISLASPQLLPFRWAAPRQITAKSGSSTSPSFGLEEAGLNSGAPRPRCDHTVCAQLRRWPAVPSPGLAGQKRWLHARSRLRTPGVPWPCLLHSRTESNAPVRSPRREATQHFLRWRQSWCHR